MAHRRGETLGQEGRYRGTTSSPPTSAKNNQLTLTSGSHVTSSSNGFAPSVPSPLSRSGVRDFHQSLMGRANLDFALDGEAQSLHGGTLDRSKSIAKVATLQIESIFEGACKGTYE